MNRRSRSLASPVLPGLSLRSSAVPARRFAAACLLSLLLAALPETAATARADGLSSGEAALAAAVDARVPHGLDLLERAVNINSGTMNFAGVHETAMLFAPEFESLGFTVRWVDGAAWNRAGHLVAERAGDDGAPHVLLIGHLDTVFEADSPFQRYTATSDTTAAGPGVSDMKGGNVVMLLALGALAETGGLDRLAVTVFLAGDEEKAGAPIDLARRDLRAAAERADVAIGFEDGDDDPRTAVIARRGASSWKLRTSGRPYHSSQIFSDAVGSGAVFEAARILAAFHEALRGEDYLTMNPGLIVGGTTVTLDTEQARGTAFGKNNVVAESTLVSGDLRTLSEAQRETAKEVMREIVAEHHPGTDAVITFSDKYPPLAPTDGNRRLLALYDQASRDLGFGPVTAVDPARAGAADVSFTAGLVEMAMDGVGLMGDGGHTVDETADLRTFPVQAKRMAVLLWRLGAGDR
jgi:glutamate carboxypeptidase